MSATVWTPPQANAFYFPGIRLRVSWWFAHTCRNRCFYCSSHVGVTRMVREGARWWTDDLAVAAWQRLYDERGPVLIELTGLEPSEQPDLVARVLRIGHAGMMNTNLGFDLERWRSAGVPTERLVLCSSYHPHQWQFEPERFVEKACAVKAAGYNLITASLVVHPLWEQQAPEWLATIREGAKLGTSVHPFIGYYRGRQYPESFDEASRTRQAAEMEEKKAALTLDLQKPDIASCATGWLYLRVNFDGTVHRCMHYLEAGGCPPGIQTQNFYRDPLVFNDGPTPCQFGACYCEQLFQYHIPHGATVRME